MNLNRVTRARKDQQATQEGQGERLDNSPIQNCYSNFLNFPNGHLKREIPKLINSIYFPHFILLTFLFWISVWFQNVAKCEATGYIRVVSSLCFKTRLSHDVVVLERFDYTFSILFQLCGYADPKP